MDQPNPIDIYNAHQNAEQQGMCVNWRDVAQRMAQTYAIERQLTDKPEHHKAPDDPEGVG